MLQVRDAPPDHWMRSAFSRAVNDDLIRLSAANRGARRIVCECSRRTCADMLEVTTRDYDAVRAHATRFLVSPGHELARVQRVVKQTGTVAIIQEHQECLRSQTGTIGSQVAGGIKPAPVLIVEDEPLICKLWAISLQSMGLPVLEAPDGLLGLARARSDSPGLVLSDVAMPELDGFQLAEALSRDEQTRRIPLIFVSGRIEATAVERAYALGAVAYLTKPCDPEAVASLAAGVLARFALEGPRRPELVA